MTRGILTRSMLRIAAHAVCWASVGVIPGGCEYEVAGTSVGTGNPGAVALGFKADSAPARVSGKIAFYAAGHNPLVDSLPLASFPVEHGDSLLLPWDGLLASLRRPGAFPDSPLIVNILLRTTDGRGAWLPGVAFTPPSGRPRSVGPGGRIDLAVVPLASFRGQVEGGDMEGERHYLTLFGSPFFSRVSGVDFGLDSLPRGRYEARLVRFLEDAPVIGDTKPAPVHALGDSLDTEGSGMLSPLPGSLGTVPLPIAGPRERP